MQITTVLPGTIRNAPGSSIITEPDITSGVMYVAIKYVNVS
jgi:hypothetical protein